MINVLNLELNLTISVMVLKHFVYILVVCNPKVSLLYETAISIRGCPLEK